MKKLMILASLCTILYISKADAQQPGGGDPAAMMQRYKDHIKPELIEKDVEIIEAAEPPETGDAAGSPKPRNEASRLR